MKIKKLKKIGTQEGEVNDNIISYLKQKNDEQKFNAIILANTDENHEIGYKYIETENLKIFANHLKTKGK